MTEQRDKPRLVFGQDRICTRCGGIGTIEVKYRGPGMKEPTTTRTACALCNGSGKIA